MTLGLPSRGDVPSVSWGVVRVSRERSDLYHTGLRGPNAPRPAGRDAPRDFQPLGRYYVRSCRIYVVGTDK